MGAASGISLRSTDHIDAHRCRVDDDVDMMDTSQDSAEGTSDTSNKQGIVDPSSSQHREKSVEILDMVNLIQS